tara:strand:- start:180 stop:368 length:189 start_codon:yes stop_codon:yes gene_type:complete
MDIETYLDQLSNRLLQLQGIIINIEGCGLDDKNKNETLKRLNEKYLKIRKIFQRNILTYCST